MKNRASTFPILIISVISFSGLQAVDPLQPTPKKNVVCVLTDAQCQQVLPGGNFGSKYSPQGNCVGWVNVTQTLLANIRFDPTKKADPAITKKAIINAFRKGTVETIPGYRSLNELITEVDAAWKEADQVDKRSWRKPAPVIHPVQQAVMELQKDQPVGMTVVDYVRSQLASPPSDTVTGFSKKLETRLRYGMPATLGIRSKLGGHAIMAVGFESESEDKSADKFYVLDSNYPDHMQVLRLERLGIEGIEDEPFWIYDELSPQSSTPEQIRKSRQLVIHLVALLAKEKNPIKKLKLRHDLKTKISELKENLGILDVKFLDKKDKSREILKTAFDARVLPTEELEMDPEQIERIFKELFKRPGRCTPQPQADLAPWRDRHPQRGNSPSLDRSHSR